MRVLSVNVGQSRPLRVGQRTIETGIFKLPVAGAVEVGPLGLAGDVQVDRKYHGGEDKAVNVYPGEHYDHWRERLAGHLEPGAFGENLTTAGLLETDVAIGDVLEIGTAVMQVTQPRQPCRTLAARHDQPQLVAWVEASRRTGFYLRCLQTGRVAAGDVIERIERAADPISVADAYDLYRSLGDCAALQRLLAEPALSAAWRKSLAKRLSTA